MFFKEWVVLFVDDEPNVLSMTKLVMKKFKVYGLPLKIYTAESKEEAIQLLDNNIEVSNSLSVAFIDVVMETEHAGLELCDYIRGHMGNSISQLYIRTGQPGITTEMDVIDQYEINGYFTKLEATKIKLYSLVKSGVRQYLLFNAFQYTQEVLKNLISASTEMTNDNLESSSCNLTGPQETLLNVVRHLGVYSNELEDDVRRWLFIDDKVMFEDDVDTGMGIAMRDKILSIEGIALSPGGDQYIAGEEGFQLIQVAEKPGQVEIVYVFQPQFAPPEHIIKSIHTIIVALSIVWRQVS